MKHAARKGSKKPTQTLPGSQAAMRPEPETIDPRYRGSAKLKGKVALISGGDSGIGRAVGVHFAREGCDVAFVYLDEDRDAQQTCRMIAAEGVRCLHLRGNAQ